MKFFFISHNITPLSPHTTITNTTITVITTTITKNVCWSCLYVFIKPPSKLAALPLPYKFIFVLQASSLNLTRDINFHSSELSINYHLFTKILEQNNETLYEKNENNNNNINNKNIILEPRREKKGYYLFICFMDSCYHTSLSVALTPFYQLGSNMMHDILFTWFINNVFTSH